MSDTVGDLIRQAIELTPMEFSITVNPHKPVFETVADYLERRDLDDFDEATWRQMLAADTIIRVGAYVTSVTQFVVYSADLETALRGLVAGLEVEAARRAE